jgi:hypothetical protein
VPVTANKLSIIQTLNGRVSALIRLPFLSAEAKRRRILCLLSFWQEKESRIHFIKDRANAKNISRFIATFHLPRKLLSVL